MAAKININKELDNTVRLQAAAADPNTSAWVSANAGTGKTHVLKTRVHRLMLAGTPPEKIMCLTYTKAAAAEMSQRVFDDLSDWVMLPDDALDTQLEKLLGRKPDATERTRARTLFARAIETPGGLQVQTIHAFCERLLKRFPLEAGLAADFTVLDDETAAAKLHEAVDAVLLEASGTGSSDLAGALQCAVRYAVDDRFIEILREALGHRDWLRFAARLEIDGAQTSEASTRDLIKHTMGLDPDDTRDAIATELNGLIPDARLQTALAALDDGRTTDQKLATSLRQWRDAKTTQQRTEAIATAFLTKEGKARSDRFITKAVRDQHPDVAAALSDARDHTAALVAKLRALDVIEATLSIQGLASAVMQKYEDAKARAAALDFDDLIERTGSLLLRPGGAEWVLYKLDGGIDHILVDESQDTSPKQWRIIEQLSVEFFSGSGAHEQVRTLFAVGDKKQSIYSFQGADPEKFANMGASFRTRAGDAELPWRDIPLNLSFRTVVPVLNAVDAVFADESRTPGVSHESEKISHIARRQGQAGLVEVWPTETWEDAADADAWAPLSDTAARPPAVRLAERIAATIADWIDNKQILQSRGRPIHPGDILILVRNRNPFANPMLAALKQRGIPVAGSDRMTLTDQIVVRDLMALGDFLNLPEDDYALACALKSPLFDFTDDDLLSFAPSRGRNKTLWRALLDHAPDSERFAAAAEQLKTWRSRADFTPPYELFAELIENSGLRLKILARLGPESADPLDEFLNFALNYDQRSPPSLSGFLEWLRGADRTIKRDMEHGRDEVRILTVHGAKGLEAPIVFLADTCTTRSGGNTAVLRLDNAERQLDSPPPFVWQIKGAGGLDAVAEAKAHRNEKDAKERNRLLYVAMTRARDRLYVAGFEGKSGRPPDCWYDLITEALGPDLQQATDGRGNPVLRLEAGQAPGTEPDGQDDFETEPDAPAALPDWALRPAPRPGRLTIPLAPSSLAPYEVDEEGEVHAPSAPSPAEEQARIEPPSVAPTEASDDSRFLRGSLTHALLEHLPAIAPEKRGEAARAFLNIRASALSPRVQGDIANEAIAVLNHPEFAAVFGPRSHAEVVVAALLPRPNGKGPGLKLNGAIDRLVEVSDEVLIVDYKTNRNAPADADGVPATYLYQLAAYRLCLQDIYPGKSIRAAIIWTASPRLMEIPQQLLDDYAQKLWTLDPTRLDD